MSSIPRNPDGTINLDEFDEPEGIRIYGHGLCYASVCSALPVEVKRIMAAYPTGISSQWTLSDDSEFASGHANPCPCEDLPETHTHYLFSC